MSGILDNKSRIIDTIITQEGRRQLALGGINIQYVTFTDAATFYKPDVSSGSQDATRRVYLEACQLPQDDVTFRADDDGAVGQFRNSLGVNLTSGKIIERIATSSSASLGQPVDTVSGQQFVLSSSIVLGSAIDNLRKMYLISSRDTIFDEEDFAMAPDDVTFTITDQRPLRGSEQHAGQLTAMDSIHTDPRFSERVNFKFMPPVNRADGTEQALRPLGTFRPLGRNNFRRLGWNQLSHELQYYGDQGYVRYVKFDPTSSENHLVGQFFERSDSALRKLDVIDHGVHVTDDQASPVVRVFFIGKVEVDEKGTDTFVHLFTLVFE